MRALTFTLIAFFQTMLFNYLPVDVPVKDKCTQSRLTALADLKKKKIAFMIQGGIVSTHVKGQEQFEQKYKIRYLDLGCMVPADLCIEGYNKEVSRYLDRLYGKAWRKEVRKDIQGI